MEQEEYTPDFLSEREGVFAESLVASLAGVPWAEPLLGKIAECGGISRAAKDFLFELRFGATLHGVGIQPQYEAPGEGHSMIDYAFAHGGKNWRVEMMRLTETNAARAATKVETDEDGIRWWRQKLSTDAPNATQSEEGETLKAVQRICQKCERDGRPHKFAAPEGNTLNVLLVDMRLFLNGASDAFDRIHIALGGDGLHGFHQRRYKGRLIGGVFDGDNQMKGVGQARERLHFIGFVQETEFAAGSFGSSILTCLDSLGHA